MEQVGRGGGMEQVGRWEKWHRWGGGKMAQVGRGEEWYRRGGGKNGTGGRYMGGEYERIINDKDFP